ncbi:2c751db1-fee3-48b6-8fba-fe9be635d9af [Sclerotinia trifoliorum]|uniref:2c751db1-fee3-48b6-8fba-fe9be635d9af n=1 Tax=Sclerotinia trifoliorum TaxID=28548 RepID=A0A8H2VRJ7_9HELO|nr:2c751db1-fee3-48b6-8fba-fe9be635d9af [Sclerotinia trifoliorum]
MPAEPSSETPIRGSEVQRVREVYRYLPAFAAPLIPLPKQDGKNAESPSLSPKAHSSSDRALNAFAQLGALRLKARRVMISLVDRTHEYILAESTRTLSSQDDDVHDAGDSLWLGVRTISRKDSLCSAVINTPRSENNRDDIFRPKVIPKVINDLADDETLTDAFNLIQGPNIRFVATVPIRSRRGFDIGAYSVFDDVPRSGLAPEELEFLTDITDTVMDHLEYIAVKRDHQRGEKMVKGLGLFVEGHSSIKSWWLRTRHYRQTSVRESYSQPTRDFGEADVFADTSKADYENASTEADLSFIEQSQEMDIPSPPIPSSISHSDSLRNDISIRSKTENYQPSAFSSIHVRKNSPAAKEEVDQPIPLTPVPVRDSFYKSPVSAAREFIKPSPLVLHNERQPSEGGKDTPEDDFSTRDVSDNAETLKRMLSRASNLMRESTDVEGVLFFDARESSFGSRGRSSSFINPGRTTSLHDGRPLSSSEDDQRTSSRINTSDSNSEHESHDKDSAQKGGTLQTRMCEVLAYSTASQCTLHGDSNLPEHLTVTENFVRRLFKRHPHGKVYAFDGEGQMSSSEDDLHDAAATGEIAIIADAGHSSLLRKASPRVWGGQTMLQIFPGARYVLVLPLWDSQRERWFASAMLWTSDPTRVLNLDDDLNYVAAFGNSIMAEVSRLDMITSDQTKNSLISSISHELRSPLHGIAGSIELLQDTQITKYQKDVVDTIGHCSATLLDTLNNVLDYAKINNFMVAQKSEQKAIRSSSRTRKALSAEKFRIYGAISLTSDLDIASITEDVINGIYTGHVYALQSTSTVTPDMDHPISPTRPDRQGIEEAQPLSVILDVDHKLNWNFLSQPGAWKRILMNILGNALKFTTSGLVKVSLNYEMATSPKSRKNLAFVTLTVSDTGRGIAADFLKRQIYIPFAQEDSLTPGAGLGLSIVRQIVGALDGKIEVFSVQGSGTVVKVVLKLEKSQPQAVEVSRMPSNIEKARNYTDGLELVLIGMETSTPEPEKSVDSNLNHHRSAGPAISRISRDWFGMKTSEATGFDAAEGDVFLVTSQKFYELENSWKNLYSDATGDTRNRHIIVLTGCAQSRRRTLFENYRNIHFLSNPIGPKKLAECFLAIFERSSGHDGSQFLAMSPSSRRTSSPSLPRSSSPLAQKSLPPDTLVSDKPIALLVEDNPINMKILIACMKKLNMRYYCAVDGQQAVSQYRTAKKKPDVIFMDISMPVMNGFEASQRIRSLEREENLKATVIVAVTGLASDESQREAYSSGINLFMSKPVPLKDLSRIVVDLERDRRVPVA